MAMPLWKILLSITRALAIVMLAMVQGCGDAVTPYYPGVQTVFDRDYGVARKVYQLSQDDFSSILAWYEHALQTVPHDNQSAPQEANIRCDMKTWQQNDNRLSVTICDYPERRTISTQIEYPRAKPNTAE